MSIRPLATGAIYTTGKAWCHIQDEVALRRGERLDEEEKPLCVQTDDMDGLTVQEL